MTAISIETQTHKHPQGSLDSVPGWLQQRMLAYRKRRALKAQMALLQSLEPAQLCDIGIDPASVEDGRPRCYYSMPFMMAFSILQAPRP